MNRFGLLGESLRHSFSPLIHCELGDYEYILYEKKPNELESFLKSGNFEGLNVTIPYKKSVIPFCSSLCETARSIGSVNTIIRKPDGSLHGDNTDYYGFKYLLQKTGVNPADGKTIVLGSGGSSLAVQAVLRDMDAKEIVVVSRNGKINYQNITEHRDAILIVNTTPVGMYPNNGLSPLSDLTFFSKCRAIIDLIYNPAKTELLMQAEEHGIFCLNGLEMLTAQAKRSAELFTNKTIPDEVIEKIGKKIAQKTLNIVLIGMPGCGKTSVGRTLAKMTGRFFADSDIQAAQATGKGIPEIICEDGEEKFRRLETETLKELCKQSGMVIATGGGAVTQPINRNIIRQNGIVIFLDRDLDQLPVSGRPLSQRGGIQALAAERLPIYRQWSDFTVSIKSRGRNSIEQAAVEINLTISTPPRASHERKK